MLDTTRRLWPWLTKVNPTSLGRDFQAGLTNATVVIPQAIAFSAMAGLPPQYGLFTALIPPVIAALAGSSWHLVSGPNSAVSAIVFSTLVVAYAPYSEDYVSAALTLTFLVGVFQISMGLARLGQLVTFVAKSVLVGFTCGAAVQIIVSQIGGLLGVQFDAGAGIVNGIREALSRISEVDEFALGLGAATMLGAILVKRRWPTAPHFLIAIIGATVVALVLGSLGVHFAHVGSLAATWPAVRIPGLSFDLVRDLSPAAFSIALVGLLQAVSISRAVASRSGQVLASNREFLGQGLSNAVGSFFSCYASSGSFTRTGINVSSGARTPLAVVFTSIVLGVSAPLLAQALAYVPTASMSAVIFLTAIELVDVKQIRQMIVKSRSELSIAVVTFSVAILVGLNFSIFVGVIVSLVIFLRRTTSPYVGIGAPDPSSTGRLFRNAQRNGLQECPQLLFLRVDGPLYFGSLDSLQEKLRQVAEQRPLQRHVLMILRSLGRIDLSTADLLLQEATKRSAQGGSLSIVSRLDRDVERLTSMGVLAGLSPGRLYESKGAAIAGIVPALDPNICRACTSRIFVECKRRPAPSDELI